MDFVTHLPRTSRGHDSMWVLLDRLIKSVNFLAMRMTYTLEELCRLYIREIVPFKIIERVGTIAYLLALSPSLSSFHVVFHISMLRKYTPDPTHAVD